ncbi:MAG: EthD family reductase [Cupriavidus necator]
MTLDEPHRWWLEEHAPIARQMPGLRGYVIHLAGEGEGGEEPEICGTDTLSFDNWEAAMAAYASPEWQAARAHGGFRRTGGHRFGAPQRTSSKSCPTTNSPA